MIHQLRYAQVLLMLLSSELLYELVPNSAIDLSKTKCRTLMHESARRLKFPVYTSQLCSVTAKLSATLKAVG